MLYPPPASCIVNILLLSYTFYSLYNIQSFAVYLVRYGGYGLAI